MVTLVTGRPRSQAVDGEVAQRPGQEATPRLEQGGPPVAQTGAGATEETESLAGSARDREGRMALSSLPSSRLPRVPLLATQGLGDGPSLRTQL